MNRIKRIPKFKSENEERKFWAKADTTRYFDVANPIKLDLSELRPSARPISLRLPEWLLADLKTLANRRDVPYQSFMKMLLAEKVSEMKS